MLSPVPLLCCYFKLESYVAPKAAGETDHSKELLSRKNSECRAERGSQKACSRPMSVYTLTDDVTG